MTFTGSISRRSILRLAGAAALTAGSATLLAACGDGTPAPAASPSTPPRRGGVLRLAQVGGGNNATLDPHFGYYTPNLHVMYNGLVVRDASFGKSLALAEEVTPDANALNWTIRLKQGLEFHNGKTVTADDVVFSFNRVIDPANGSTFAGSLSQVQQVTTLDDRTVRVTLKSPTAWFDSALQFSIVPVDFTREKAVGTGAFKADSFSPGSGVVYSRFDNYFDTPALLDRVEASWIPDVNARWNALVSGQVDVVDRINPVQATQVATQSGIGLYNSPTGSFSTVFMRTDEGPFSDERVRKAFQLAIDRKQVLASGYGGYGTIANDLYAPFDPAFRSDLVRERDTDQARKLLQEAQATDLRVTLNVYELYGGETAFAQVLAENLAEVGPKIDVVVQTDYTKIPKDVSIGINHWPNNTFFATSAEADGPGASFNKTRFSDPEYTALWYEGSRELDDAKRNVILGKLQQILFDRGGSIIPVYEHALGAYSTALSGFSDDVTGFGLSRGLRTVGFAS